MKKKVIIITSIVIMAAVIIAISTNYPPIFKEDAKGSIGKVEKYRNEQISEEDIILRSEILKDTARLNQIIQELLSFNIYTVDLTENIDFWVNDLKEIYTDEKDITPLKEYGEFVKNNNTVLVNTINILLDYYLDPKEMSEDLDNKMNAFANYVYGLEQKEPIIEKHISKSEDYIAKNKAVEERKEEVEKLMSIRDNMLINNLQFVVMSGNTEKLNVILNKTLFNNKALENQGETNAVEKLGSLYSTDKLNAMNNNGLLSFVSNKGVLGGFIGSFNKEKLGYVVANNEKLGRVANKEKLGYVVANKEKLGSILKGHIGSFNKEKLGRMANKEKLGRVANKEKLGFGFMSWSQEILGSPGGDLGNSDQVDPS